jgi:hypothetical protein
LFLGLVLNRYYFYESCRALKHQSLPPMPRRLIHDTGYWERGGAVAFGKVTTVSGLWLADQLSPTRRG